MTNGKRATRERQPWKERRDSTNVVFLRDTFVAIKEMEHGGYTMRRRMMNGFAHLEYGSDITREIHRDALPAAVI